MFPRGAGARRSGLAEPRAGFAAAATAAVFAAAAATAAAAAAAAVGVHACGLQGRPAAAVHLVRAAACLRVGGRGRLAAAARPRPLGHTQADLA